MFTRIRIAGLISMRPYFSVPRQMPQYDGAPRHSAKRLTSRAFPRYWCRIAAVRPLLNNVIDPPKSEVTVGSKGLGKIPL
jgi:hypothetical protein